MVCTCGPSGKQVKPYQGTKTLLVPYELRGTSQGTKLLPKGGYLSLQQAINKFTVLVYLDNGTARNSLPLFPSSKVKKFAYILGQTGTPHNSGAHATGSIPRKYIVWSWGWNKTSSVAPSLFLFLIFLPTQPILSECAQNLQSKHAPRVNNGTPTFKMRKRKNPKPISTRVYKFV